MGRPDLGQTIRIPIPSGISTIMDGRAVTDQTEFSSTPHPDQHMAPRPGTGQVAPVTPHLVELAQAHGVATEFWDWQGRHVEVSRRTIVAVLAALGVDAGTEETIAVALAEVQDRAWHRTLPDTQVIRAGAGGQVMVHVPHGEAVELRLLLEDGQQRQLEKEDRWVDPRQVDGHLVGETSFLLPQDLPLGWHRLHARFPSGAASGILVVAPRRLRLPRELTRGQTWGYMSQLYAVRSERSWGLGDLADLADLADWSARDQGAGFVLVNPLHSAQLVPPMEPSPYLPTTRRFVNPIYLRVEDIPEVAYLPAADRAIVEWQAEELRVRNADAGELDRDTIWNGKQAALGTVFAQPRSRARETAFRTYCVREGQGLLDFATWCALAEHYGLPRQNWPAHAADPHSPAVAQLREELSERVEFHMWLQWCLDEQLQKAQRTALEAGMAVGIIHDLAVGVHPDGADAWAMAEVLAQGVTVGAPPDAFNQQGQDWNQPPLRPDRLEQIAYEPFRDIVRSLLRNSGGIRIDHVLGLFRSWWVPRGMSPAEGTYVRNDHEALIGILALEAQRAGALVIGEDLGNFEPWVRDYLAERGILGNSVLWFEKDGGQHPARPETWRELCLATVTTHDLPPTAGYLAGEHVALRERLGLLTRPASEELSADRAERAAVLELLRELGLLGYQANERDAVEALHRFLTWTPSRLLGVCLADAVGDHRTINQPGTRDEYPNWRLPLADPAGNPVMLEELMASSRAASLAQAVSGH
jgi:4-alpha-glucanotransferase